jgi:hypothetical protein
MRYRVELHRYVEQTAVIEIEARNAEEAQEIARYERPAAMWTRGAEVTDGEVLSVEPMVEA